MVDAPPRSRHASVARPRLAPCLLAALLLSGGCSSADRPGSALLVVTVSPPSVSVTVGRQHRFTASGIREDWSTAPLSSQVTWSSSDQAVATVDSAGLVSAVGVGEATITAREATSGLSGQGAIRVDAPVLQSMSLAPATSSLAAGRSLKLVVTGRYDDGERAVPPSELAWSSSEPGRATVDPEGLVRGVTPGGIVVRVVHAASGLEASGELLVTGAVLEAVTVAPGTGSLAPGLALQLEATGRLSDGTAVALVGEIAWSSSAPDVATVGATGLAGGVASGQATITAEHVASGLSSTAALTVTESVLERLVVSPATASVPSGLSQRLAVVGVASDGLVGPLAGALTWSVDDPAVASIDSTGLLRGLHPGSAKVVARHGPSGLVATVPVTVTPALLLSISLSPDPFIMTLGSSPWNVLTATGYFTDGASAVLSSSGPVPVDWQPPQWSSSPDGIVAIDDRGRIEGLAYGTATVTITDVESGVSGSSVVEVVPDRLISLTIWAPRTSLAVGETTVLSATGRMLGGGPGPIYLQGSLEWASSDASVATVDSQGLVRAMSAGSCTLTGTDRTEGVTGSLVITVSP